MDGTHAGAGDRLRPLRALILRALIPAGAAAGLWNLLGGEEAATRLAATVILFAAACLVWGPLLGTSREPAVATAAGAVGYLLAFAVLAVFTKCPGSMPLAAGAGLASFLVFTSGTAAVSARVLRRSIGGMAVAICLGILCLSSFHLGDPLLHWESSVGGSETALTLLHYANPLSGALGDAVAMDPDWLRRPYMYDSEAGFSAAGDLQLFRYAPWWAPVLLHGLIGAVSLWLAGFRVSDSVRSA